MITGHPSFAIYLTPTALGEEAIPAEDVSLSHPSQRWTGPRGPSYGTAPTGSRYATRAGQTMPPK